ncbi:MAG: ATP-binding protein [Burkholderiaceae bacterium]
MPRKTSPSLLWLLVPDDPVAVPNARLALALLRCAPRLSGTFPAHDHDDLGAALAPALTSRLPQLRKAIKTYRASRHAAADCDVDSDCAALLNNHSVHTLLGEALVRHYPAFRALFADMEARLVHFIDGHTHPCDQNVETLVGLLALSTPEAALWTLAGAFCHGTIAHNMFSFVNSASSWAKVVEPLCAAKTNATVRMFDSSRALARSGLFSNTHGFQHSNDLGDLLQLSALGERLLSVQMASAAEMANAVLTPLALPPVGAAPLAWPHLANAQTLLGAALAEATRRGTPGINVLLHGAPGTGKTEFASALVASIGAAGFSIDPFDHDGDEASRDERLASLRLAQTFASQRDRAVLVLDETEDIFQSDYQNPLFRVFGAGEHESKAWTNQLLEKNPHPVIWISNQVAHLDPAYLRRFTFCLEFPRTPHGLRRSIATERLSTVGCSAQVIEAVAADEQMTPALLTSAVRFADLSAVSGLGPDRAVTTLVEQHRRAAGQSGPPLHARRLTRFDIGYLNVAGNATPQRVLGALQSNAAQPTALVFSGAPGTGKTQFAAELAERLGRQLVLRTASDIHSMWYGQSERNVATMFRECDPKSELLFLDEAEVLLGARSSTTHRADRAVTAEFLRWLEAFQGIFVCATNHLDDFDAALLRRFAFRLEFKPLSRVQREAMYAELVHGRVPAHGNETADPSHDAGPRLARLDLLTAGDFANAARRIQQLGLGVEAWLDELEAEQLAKPQARAAISRMGFV